MDMPPQNDQVENAAESFDAASLDSRISEAEDVSDTDLPPEQPPEAQVTPPEIPAKPPENPANPPPEHIPAAAVGEAGNAARAEKGPERKPEVKNFHPGGPERGW